MDKIIALICEEARRRPGKRLVPKLYQLSLEVSDTLNDLMRELVQTERDIKGKLSSEKAGVNGSGIKQP